MNNKNTIAEICRAAFFKAVSLKRSAGSRTEAMFVAELTKLGVTLIDEAGNLHFDRRDMGDGKLSRSMFTAHTDTVHRGSTEGPNKYKWYNTKAGVEWVEADGDVLGADDGSGLAILITMMAKKVPGYYIFFRSEECGGIGSSHFADEFKPLLKEFDRAVAFDRRGYGDVISHQASGRCCSDVFATALATALNDQSESFMYSPCDGGVFTDTANLTDGIPECTNISVAYDSEHTVKEAQDMTHLIALATAACSLRWEDLPTSRDPKEVDDWFGWGRGKGRGKGSNDYLGKDSFPWPSTWADDEDDNVEVEEIELLQALESALFDKQYTHLVKLVVGFASPLFETAALKLSDEDYKGYVNLIDSHTPGFLCDIIKDDLKKHIPVYKNAQATPKSSSVTAYDKIRQEMAIENAKALMATTNKTEVVDIKDVKVVETASTMKAAKTAKTSVGKAKTVKGI